MAKKFPIYWKKWLFQSGAEAIGLNNLILCHLATNYNDRNEFITIRLKNSQKRFSKKQTIFEQSTWAVEVSRSEQSHDTVMWVPQLQYLTSVAATETTRWTVLWSIEAAIRFSRVTDVGNLSVMTCCNVSQTNYAFSDGLCYTSEVRGNKIWLSKQK